MARHGRAYPIPRRRVWTNTVQLLVTGTGTFTSAASSLSAEGAQLFTGTASLTSAASTLDILGQLQYNGTVAFAPAAASLAAQGSVATAGQITGVGAFTTAPASFRAKGRRRLKAGHDLVDLARYDQFVSQAEPILEELGQDPQPTGATAPVLDPVPTTPVERPADYREFLANTLSTLQVDPVAIPAIRIKGKAWVKGHATLTAEPVWLAASGGLIYHGASRVRSVPARLKASGSVDNYYTIRKQDDELLAEFLLANLSGVL